MSNTIKPQDLRINNIVQHNGVYWMVTDIISPAPRKDKRFSDKWVIGLMNGGVINVAIEEIEPVELTEEILVKCGFEYYNDQQECLIKECWCKGARSELFYYPKEVFKLILKSRYEEDFGKSRHLQSLPHIEYLHQLINLFYQLTGRELEIKL